MGIPVLVGGYGDLLYEFVNGLGKLGAGRLGAFGFGSFTLPGGEGGRHILGKVATGSADNLAPVGLFKALAEFRCGRGNRFEKNFSDTGESVGLFRIEAAFGDRGKKTRNGLGESGCGDKAAGNGVKEVRGGAIGFFEVAELALVVEAVFRLCGRAKHAAMAAIGIGEGTSGRTVIGIVGSHRILQFKSEL